MVRVVVFVNELTSTSIPVETAIKTHTETNANILLVSYYDNPADEFDPDLELETLPVVCLGATSRLDYRAYRTLRRLCIEWDIDVIHTHHNSTGSLGRIAVSGIDTKVINTEHNDHRFFSDLQRSVNSITYPLVDAIIYNSKNTEKSLEWYERLLAKQSRHEVIYNGIDKSRIDRAQKVDIDLPEGPIISTAGRLVEQKNHTTLLSAFAQVSDDISKTNLVIIGNGPLRDDLEELARDLAIQNSVMFTGYLPRREDVYGVLRASTIGIFSSLYEGFCVAAVEAMAVGLPLVVSDIDVLHEVVGDPGIYADPNDPAEFADAISYLLNHPQERDYLAAAAKERARSKFTLERTAREYYNIYKQVAETAK